MKTMYRYKQFVWLFIIVLVLTMFPNIPAQAGLNKIVVDNTSCEEKIDEAVWSNPDGDVEGRNRTIYFSEESTDETRLITRSATKYSEYTEKLLDAEFTVKFSKLPENQMFSFGMGLNSIESMSGESGNIEVCFLNKQGLQVKVVLHDENGDAVSVSENIACGSVNSKTKVAVSLSSNKNLKVTVGGKTICNTTIAEDGDGNVGFFQTGSCSAEISDFIITFYQYDRPENTNIEEDFEEGLFNANLLHSQLLTGTKYEPCKMQVEEYNGSNVLMIQNVAMGYIGTRYTYSNFELTFDVPYLQTVTEVNENGEVIMPRSAGFGVSFGDESSQYTTPSFGTSADLVIISGTGAYSRNKKYSGSVTDHPFGAVGAERPFSVRVSMIDGIVTVGVKWLEETEYEDFLTYPLEETPTGYIHIWAATGSSTSFAIDNLKIINKDNTPNLVDVAFESAKLNVPDDYEFVSQGLVYNPDSVKETDSDIWYWPILVVAGSCAVVLGMTAVGVTFKNRRKGGKADEEKSNQANS